MHRDGKYRLYAFAGVLAIIALSFLVYGSTLKGEFVLDDNYQIVGNPWIRSYRFIVDIITSHSFAFSKDVYQAISYRPLVFLVFMVEHAFFGLEPWGWHLTNVLLHAANGILLFLLVKKLLPGELKGLRAFTVAFAAAVFFVTLPVNSEAASWIACVPELVYTLSVLVAFYTYLIFRERGGAIAFLALSAAFYTLAMFTKETAIFFPAIILLYEAANRAEKMFSAKVLFKYAPYGLAAIFFLAVRYYAIGNMTPAKNIITILTGPQYLLNIFPLFIKYLRSLVLPIGNYPLQLFDPVFSITEPRAFLSVLATLTIALFLFLFRKRIGPVHAISLGLIILPLLPVFYMPFVSRIPFADRYLYLPSAGLAIGLSLLFSKVETRRTGIMLAVMFAGLIMVNSAWAVKRSAVWKDDRSLWSEAAAGSPSNYIALHSIGYLDIMEGKSDDGIARLKSALKINLESWDPDLTMMVFTHMELGKEYHKKGLLDEAVREYNEVLRLLPQDRMANFELGVVFQEKGFYHDAVDRYRTALTFTHEPSQRKDVLMNLGGTYLSMGLKNEALASYDEALALAPGDPEILSAVQSTRERR